VVFMGQKGRNRYSIDWKFLFREFNTVIIRMSVSYDPRWLENFWNEGFHVLIGFRRNEGFHILCSAEVKSVEEEYLKIVGYLPGGLEIIGVAKGPDMKHISRPKLAQQMARLESGVIVEFGTRVNFFVFSKTDIRVTDEVPKNLEFQQHVLTIPVRVTVNPNQIADQLCDWFDDSITLMDHVETIISGVRVINHRAKVKICEWKRRFLGQCPREVKTRLNLITVVPSDEQQILQGFRESLSRQALRIDDVVEVFPVEPYPGLEILLPSSSPSDLAPLGWAGKRLRQRKTSAAHIWLKPDKIILILGILAVFLALIITSIK
jgi:hypothetical protein